MIILSDLKFFLGVKGGLYASYLGASNFDLAKGGGVIPH